MTEEEWRKPWEYVCVLCGYEYKSLDGLLSHIQSVPHVLTLVQYGTLNRAARGLEKGGGGE